MKKLSISLVVLLSLLSTTLYAMGGKDGSGMKNGKQMGNYRAVSPEKAEILQDGENKNYCPICGMTLPMFYKTNHAGTDEKGDTHQYCSIVCEVEDAVKNGTKLHDHKVVDNTTLKFIDSKSSSLPSSPMGVYIKSYNNFTISVLYSTNPLPLHNL